MRVIGTMKTRFIYLAAIITAAAITFPGNARAGTSEVYRLTMSFTGIFQGTNDLSQAKEIQYAEFFARDIINLATGQPFNSPVPTNEVLAYVDGGSTNSIVVYDKNAGSNLVTVAQVTSRGSVSQPGLQDFVWNIRFVNLGDATNGFGAGTNALNGAFLQAEGTKITKHGKFQVFAHVDGTVNADTDGNSFHLLVPSGNLSFGSPAIGKIVTTAPEL